MKPGYRVVGTAQRRVDAWGKVTGRAKYAEDYNLAHQLTGRVLRAAHPHARILRIDTSRAERLPGVAAVLTARDIPGSKVFGVVTANQAILAEDRVRHLGDGVALVAAESREVADRALGLIRVEYEPLPVVSDPEAAMRPDAPRIHGEDNVFVRHQVSRGDVRKGFAEAEIVLERRFRTQFVEHAYLEPEAVLAEPAEHGGVRVTGSIQNLFSSRRSVAAALRLDLNRVQLVQATLGGSFGGKDEVMTALCCRAALLALRTGRPVKMVNTREESMLESYKRHPYILDYRWGAKRDGTLTAMEIRCVADGGAYASMSPFVTWRSVVQATGPYRCEHVHTEVLAVYTNNVYTGAMRGFGSPQVNFAIESMMDELAGEVGLDPLEIRLRNGFEQGAVTATGQRLDHVVSLKEVLAKAAAAADFQRRWRECRDAPPGARRRGIGLACSYRGVALGAEGTDAAGVIVSVQTDGSVIVSSGVTDMGQGAQTQMSQIAAEVLGIGMERILFLNTNTSRVPDSGPTVASRATIMGGSAAKRAAETVRTSLLQAAAEWTALPADQLLLADGWLLDGSTGERLASFSELAAECFRQGRPLLGFGWHKAPHTDWHAERGQGIAYFTFVYGANIAEVEVDTETGKTVVTGFTSAHEVGQAISRSGVEAQIYGGVAMGLGYGLLEDFEIEDGVPRQLNFDEYLLPTALDVPPVRAILVENPDPAGPFGAKSIGEPANELAAPAIVNAIANATGRRIRELPATLERVLLGHPLSRRGPRGSLQQELPVDGACKVRPRTHETV
ncbi:MAG TPA: xanthine dehydrogenase family protein molybdopterin-binding subunit [Candidatus Saccharimonadales bacterium]|nr:xanthine dehydrogenase family protein molybdopterin-binding subunit [Candidatus Saccharimonadales bacterium]